MTLINNNYYLFAFITSMLYLASENVNGGSLYSCRLPDGSMRYASQPCEEGTQKSKINFQSGSNTQITKTSEIQSDPCSSKYVTALDVLKRSGTRSSGGIGDIAAYNMAGKIAKKENRRLDQMREANCAKKYNACSRDSDNIANVCVDKVKHSMSCIRKNINNEYTAKCEVKIDYKITSEYLHGMKDNQDSNFKTEAECKARITVNAQGAAALKSSNKTETIGHTDPIGQSEESKMSIVFNITSGGKIKRINLDSVECGVETVSVID